VHIVAETELLHLRHTGLGYVITLAFALLITVLAEEKPAKKAAVATAIVGASSIPLYTLYVPSYGSDTWRDILWVAQALQKGHVTETAVRHSAYPFPVVPLEYALVSLNSGLDPAWVSVVTGPCICYRYRCSSFCYPRGLVGSTTSGETSFYSWCRL
jgi:hypothetical protein